MFTNRIAKETSRKLGQISKQSVSIVPDECRKVCGQDWFDDEIQAKVKSILDGTSVQEQITMLISLQMIQDLQKATNCGIDATFDLAGRDNKVRVKNVLRF